MDKAGQVEVEEEEFPDHSLARSLRSRVDELEDRLARTESWGYLRKGNAYAKPSIPKPQPEPLDIADEQAPHG